MLIIKGRETMEKDLKQKEWEEMARYFANEMDSEEFVKYSAKLNSIVKLKSIANQIKSDWDKMEKFKIVQEFDNNKAWEKLYGKLENDGLIGEMKQEPAITRTSLLLRIAAIFIISVLFASIIYYLLDNPAKTNWNVAETYDNNAIKEIQLPDGSIAILNAGSKLYYPDKFSGKERVIEFEGDAFFEIKKNPDMPFLIKVKQAEIKVLGTSFNVNTNLENSDIEVLVTSGKVKFAKIQDQSVSVILEPGYIGTLSKDKIISQINSDKNYLAWKTRYFNFTEGIKLGQAIQILNRAYNVRIICDDKQVCEKILNSTFDQDSLDKIIEVICSTYNLKIEKKNGEIHLFD